jgi:hypothetical protein
MFHCVFTEKNSLFTGWHEYNYCAISETERWRRYDKTYSVSSTNIEHPSVYETIDHMFAYLGMNKTIGTLFIIAFHVTASHGYL